MIKSLPGLQIIYTLFLLQPMQVLCVDTTEIQQLERKAKQVFGYDFNTSLKEGDVLIWKISGNSEPFTPLNYDKQSIKFVSDETYVLTTKKPEYLHTIFYWLGANTSLTQKKEAAKYAILLTNIYQPRLVLIARETEGMESDSFQHTMKMFNKTAAPHMTDDYHASYLDMDFISPRPNLYVVRGEKYSRIKKIPLSLGIKWLKETNVCLVLEAGYEIDDMLPSNFYCSVEASENFVLRSKNFTHDFGYYTIYDEPYEHEIDDDKRSNDFKKFLEVFEDSRYYNPNEVDDSGDHLKTAVEFCIDRDKEVLLFDVTTEGRKENVTRPIHSRMFINATVRHLLDTKSVAGVFLLLTRSIETEDKLSAIENNVKAIQLAEEYIDEKYPLSSGKLIKMRITERISSSYILDLAINLSDYPDPLMRIMADNELEE